jgi:hypothetical protein
VKPPVSWIVIFFLAETAQRKLTHGGVFSVVGQALDNGKAWTTVGASDKEIFKTLIFGVT